MKSSSFFKESAHSGSLNMDIEAWSKLIGFVELQRLPSLPCPYCHKTELQLDHNSVSSREIPKKTLEESRKYQKEKEIFENSQKALSEKSKSNESGIIQLFSILTLASKEFNNPLNGSPSILNCFFACQSCKQSVSASGIALKSEKVFNNDGEEASLYIKFEHFYPSLVIFPISQYVPKLISDELLDAFKYFHFDPPSSAAKLRRAIERFCDDQGLEGNNLNRKVQNLAKTYPQEAMYLEALKLVGNEGTHGTNVDELDLLYSFQIFKFVLELYDRDARFKALDEMYHKLAEKVGRERLQLEYKPNQVVCSK